MIETIVILAIVAGAIVHIRVARRNELRRSRQRAEGVLDELAEVSCRELAHAPEGRRAARAVRRYERTREQVARATTRRQLDGVVARHRRRQRAADLVERTLLQVRRVAARRTVA